MEDLRLENLPEIFDRCISFWHNNADQVEAVPVSVNPLVLELVFKNYSLWHEEDKARRTDVNDETIATVKRRIDVLNQQRNDQIEKIDEMILDFLEKNTPENVSDEINSETPGSIVDRLSIISLKIYHMNEDTMRDDISSEHKARSRQKLAILNQQRADLHRALLKLIDDYFAGTRRMKIYRQYKMYNDPELNPEVYGRQK